MAKKKKTKYIVLGIVGILVILVLLNWGNIKFMFDMMNSYKKYEDVEKTPESEKEDAFEDKNPLLEAIEKEKVKTNSETQGTTEDEKDDSSSVNESNKKNENVEKPNKETYVTILSKYNDKFASLQSDYEGKLNSLVVEGYNDYKSGHISNSKLASKYIAQGRTMEKESDEKVNALLKEMERDLKANGLDTSIVKDVKNYYYEYKEMRRGEIMAKAKKAVK